MFYVLLKLILVHFFHPVDENLQLDFMRKRDFMQEETFGTKQWFCQKERSRTKNSINQVTERNQTLFSLLMGKHLQC